MIDIDIDPKVVLMGVGMLCTAVSAIAGAAWATSRAVTSTKETISALSDKTTSLSAECKTLEYANDTCAREIQNLKERAALLEQSRDHSMQEIKATEERFAKALDTAVDSLRREMQLGFDSLRQILLRKNDG